MSCEYFDGASLVTCSNLIYVRKLLCMVYVHVCAVAATWVCGDLRLMRDVILMAVHLIL